MNLKDLNTTKFLVDPNNQAFVRKMIALSHDFDFLIPRVDKKKALRWLVLMYDKNSYFRKDINNFLQRMYEAGVTAGFSRDGEGKFSKDVENFMIGENDDFNKAVTRYLIAQYNVEYVKLVAYDFNYYKLYKASIKSWDKDMKKLMDDMMDDINELHEKLYGFDAPENMRKALYERTDASKLDIRPEAMAEKFMMNGLIDLNQWGDYDLTQVGVNFVGDELPK